MSQNPNDILKSEVEKTDMVNHPPHYMRNGTECIDWIEMALTPEEFRGYLKGSYLKYLWRHEDKGKPIIDLDKAKWFVDKLEETLRAHDKQEADIDARAEEYWNCPALLTPTFKNEHHLY